MQREPHPDLAPSQKLKGESCWDPGMPHVDTGCNALLDKVQMTAFKQRQLDLQVSTAESDIKVLALCVCTSCRLSTPLQCLILSLQAGRSSSPAW